METSSLPGDYVAGSTPDPSKVEESATALPTHNASAPRLNPRSCVTCRRRKVRCNKENPCANCVRAGIECVFPAPGRAPRKSKKAPDAELLARLRRLEGVVHSLGAQVDDNGLVSPSITGSADIRARTFGETHSGDSPTSDRSDSKRQSIDRTLGRLVISDDRSRYVSNTFWTSMSDEVHKACLKRMGLYANEVSRSPRCKICLTLRRPMTTTKATRLYRIVRLETIKVFCSDIPP